ncbi:MAG: hypothetical protein J6R99_02815 [Alphaproteobacteria bacterium]|nr:hypothetical protein [Alphaproteobacteria bacterium]MBO7066618.1 hypothetical protein [Alphaproteobacteria bacterium]
MQKVDTWLGTPYDIYVDNNGMYYVCCNGAIVSPAYATLHAAQHEGKIYVKG